MPKSNMQGGISIKRVLGLKTLHLGPENLMANIDVHLEDNLTTDQIEKIRKNNRKDKT